MARTVASVVTPVSGKAVKISGETVVTRVSGEVVQISGQVVSVSGPQVVKVSGETVVLPSTQVVKISGETVTAKVSGETVSLPATQAVKVSGETVIGKISGETVIAKVSGEVVQISGQSVEVASGLYLASGIYFMGDISGQFVYTSGSPGLQVSGAVQVSGTVEAKVSGETLTTRPELPTGVSGGYLQLASGRTQLPNVPCVAATVRALPTGEAQSGNVWLGGATVGSGAGFLLTPGDSFSVDMDNPNRLHAWAQVSGDYVSWIAINY